MKLLAMLVWNQVVKILFLGILVDCCSHDEVKYISKNTIEDIKNVLVSWARYCACHEVE